MVGPKGNVGVIFQATTSPTQPAPRTGVCQDWCVDSRGIKALCLSLSSILVERSQQPLPYPLLPVCPSRENKVEVKTEAGSKGNRSYKISFMKVEKVSDSCLTLCLRKLLGRDFLRCGSQHKVFLG